MAAITINQNINFCSDGSIFESDIEIYVPVIVVNDKKIPIFINDTNNSVILSTWEYGDYGMVIYKRKLISPNKQQPLNYSNTNEFIIDSEQYERLGKFRLETRPEGKNHWMVSDQHDILSHTPSCAANHPYEYRLVTLTK